MSVEYVTIGSIDEAVDNYRSFLIDIVNDEKLVNDYTDYLNEGKFSAFGETNKNIILSLMKKFEEQKEEIIKKIGQYKSWIPEGDTTTHEALNEFEKLAENKEPKVSGLLTLLYNASKKNNDGFFSRLEYMTRLDIPEPGTSESDTSESGAPRLGKTRDWTKTIILAIIIVLSGMLIIPILVILGYLLYRTAVLPANHRWSLGKILKNAALWPLNLRGIAAY